MRVTGTVRTLVASVTMTLAVWTKARCPECDRLVVSFPGSHRIETRRTQTPTGRGPVMACQRCKTLLEVISHG